MSAHIADHEARLRAALHAAAESLEPNPDGLERIHARLRQPRPASAWLRAAYGEIAMRAPTWLQDMVYQVAHWLRLAYERFSPAQAPGRHRSRTQGLLRPLAAMAVVMFIVAAGTYVAIDASTAIFPSSTSNAPSGGGPNAGGHPGASGRGASHASGTQSAAGTGHPAAAPSCPPKPGRTTSSAPSQQSPGASPSASPSTDASTSTDTSSPSPADTGASPAATVAPSPVPSANPPASSPSPGLVAKSPGC